MGLFDAYTSSTYSIRTVGDIITLSTQACGINFVSSLLSEEADEMETVTEQSASFNIKPSVISSNLDIRVVRIKDKETGLYLSASHSKHPDSESNAVNLANLSENLDQIWEIKLIDDDRNVYGLRPFTKKDHLLYIDPICGYCLTDDSSKIPAGALSAMAGVSIDLNNNLEGTILFPSVNGYLAFATYQNGIWARHNKINTRTWIIEEPEQVIINKWLKLDYNPQKKHANNAKPRVVDIPDYAFEIPSEYIKDSEHNIGRKAVYGYSLSDPEAVDTEQNRNYYQCYEVEVRESKSDDPTDNLYATCVYAPLQNSTKIIPYYFSERRRWGVIGEYTSNYIKDNVPNFGSVKTFIDSDGKDYSILVDDNGFYWVAVGPNVVTKNHYSPNGRPGNEMYDKGTLDVVLKRCGTEDELFYIHCKIGDIKAHTWNNGVIQTGFEYWLPRDSYTNEYNIADRPYESVVSVGDSYNYTVCVEFMGDTENSNLYPVNNFYNINSKYRDYELVEIIFYPYEPEE